MTNTSRTLDEIGVTAEINESGRYDAVRGKMMALYGDPTKKREMRKIAAAPDFALGSVQAVTEDGEVLIASATGSQLGQYPYSAGKVIWVAGTHKIVADDRGRDAPHPRARFAAGERARQGRLRLRQPRREGSDSSAAKRPVATRWCSSANTSASRRGPS